MTAPEENVTEPAGPPEDQPPAAGPLTNAITALVLLGAGVAAVVASWTLGVGTAREPDSGMWPLLIGVALIVLGAALLAKFRTPSDAERFTRSGWPVLGGLATMVVFVVVLEYVGFEIPATLLCFAWLRFLGRESLRVSIVGSLAVVAVFYAVFVGALSVPIPHLL
ncbi:tripartite tricarboxylate transporter TctB family protein [Amycolatopsis magusensis]|uniref:tripartite tricarboxylate transporter TctB family protein n=1 Tax=Amycolatopsis magusensis TaxID=882444 RepID=UPI003C2F3CFF